MLVEPILPRQGEVAPKVTEGGKRDLCSVSSPLRLARASHLPLRIPLRRRIEPFGVSGAFSSTGTAVAQPALAAAAVR